ncbi:MAG: EAL domain-containing protein [Lachnospiraceae bacterium]|nr:EAL domain-containing protein [Lachnospiraceae bacterium]
MMKKSEQRGSNVAGMADEGLFLRYAEEIRLRGHLSEYSAFYFNIEGLQEISEKYGFQESRKVTRQYSGHLLKFLGNDEFLGYLSGDNFVALIKLARTDTFRRFISDIEVETVYHGKVTKHHLSAVVGIWEMSDEEVLEIREVISNPALAFIEAKYILYQPYVSISSGRVSRANQQKEVTEAFHEAILRKEFLVYYQPKVDAATNTLVGAEGLVRWRRNGKLVSPGVFIRPLEQTGDILQLDYFVLRTICNDIKQWKAQGIEPVPISANFSRRNLLDEDLAENIDYIISSSGIDKNLIEVEIEETKESEEHEFMTDFVCELYDRGIRTAVDNFGSGFASLSALREFSVHTIKIDRSFINTDDFSQKDEIVLTHIIQMAKELGVNVVTQGVEREDQLTFVKNAGCNLIQGYYFDRPLEKSEFEKRLKKKDSYA